MGLCARDVMTGDLVGISPGESLADLERLLLSRRVGGVPVVEGERLVGVVTRSDVVRVLSTEQTLAEVRLDFYREYYEDPTAPSSRLVEEAEEDQERAAGMVATRLASRTVRDAMVATVLTVDTGDALPEVARRLVDNHVHRLIVTDGDRPVGIVSTTDLVRLVAEGRLA